MYMCMHIYIYMYLYAVYVMETQPSKHLVPDIQISDIRRDSVVLETGTTLRFTACKRAPASCASEIF